MKRKGSMTVEAALVLPVFLYAMVLLSYLGLFAKCQDEVQWALTRMGREASAEYGATENNAIKSNLYYLTKLNLYLKGSGVKVTFFESHLLEENDEIDLIAKYHVKAPFSLIPLDSFSFRERVHTRAFTGVENRGEKEQGEDELVYVTDTGRVYHRSLSCTYLKLSISQVLYGDLAPMRNEGGGKYKPCDKCCENKKFTNGSIVWTTNYGDRFHSSRACSGIKRTIKTIHLSEISNRTPCSKCGKEKES